jgi:hypothetical protein
MARIDRRSILEGSLGLALAGGVLDAFGGPGAVKAHAQADQRPAGANPQGVRRIITANNAKGRSFIVSDDLVTGGALPNLFRTSGANPLGPGAAGELRTIMPTDAPNLEPAPGGCNFTYVNLPPMKSGDKPFWHRTATLDFNILLSGELELLLEEGQVTLRPFSVVIQRNTNHAWRNTSATEPVRWVAILLPAGGAA